MTELDESSTHRVKDQTISVIIPVFNDSVGVKTCLLALTNQTWPMELLEVVVVDNDSQPALEIDQDYPFNLRLLKCLTPGSYAARNLGAKSAKGKILAFTDADCIPSPNWLESGAHALKAGSGTQLIGGEVILSKPQPLTATARYQLVTGFQQEDNILSKGFTATANLFCFHSQYLSVGPFEERLLSGGDREWCWRAHRKGYKTNFAKNAIVHTAPRTSLSAAIRQARRVAAGRLYLKQYGLASSGASQIKPHRSSLESILWIVNQPTLSYVERMQVFFVASTIKLATLVENARLRLGSEAERR